MSKQAGGGSFTSSPVPSLIHFLHSTFLLLLRVNGCLPASSLDPWQKAKCQQLGEQLMFSLAGRLLFLYCKCMYHTEML